MNKYYVYFHRKKTNGEIFYVGKGNGQRATSKQGRSDYWFRTVNKHGYTVEYVDKDLSEQVAFELEEFLISFLQDKVRLCNLTKGGEGSSGLNFSDQQRLNIAAGLRNRSNQHKVDVVIKRTSTSGRKNCNANTSVHTFVRLSDGLEVTCDRYYLCENFGAKKCLIKKLFKKDARKSADGWKLKG